MIVPKMGETMDADPLAKALFGKTRRTLLGLFFSHPEREFYFTELARQLRLGSGALQRELQSLVAVGILRRHTRGKHVLFQANQDCPIFPELRALVEKTLGAPILLRRLLTPFAPGIRVALLFGSWAQAQTTTGSDLDLLVVGDVSPLELTTALLPAEEKLGREVNPVVLTPAEFRDRVGKQDHFLSTVLEGPKIFLIGDEHELERLAGRGNSH